MQTVAEEASEILQNGRRSCPTIVQHLSQRQVEGILRLERSHKKHPLLDVLDSVSGERSGRVSANTNRSLEAALQRNQLAGWARAQLEACSRERDFANASARLGELRAAGFLALAGCNPTPIPVAMSPRADFQCAHDGNKFIVEVHTKQMNADESAALKKFTNLPPPTGMQPGKAYSRAHHVSPAGKARHGETTAENVASKFAQIKPGARQSSENRDSFLWLDLQDPDWWTIDPPCFRPISIYGEQLYSPGLWHAFYGVCGSPMFEHTPVGPLGSHFPIAEMKHDGLFKQNPTWNAAIVSLPTMTALFGNPEAEIQLSVIERLFRLPWFSLSDSVMPYPRGKEDVQKIVNGGHDILHAYKDRAAQS